MNWTSLLVFASVYAVAVATPGPGIAALVARTLGRGTAGAFPFILGFVVGDLIWFLAAAAGLSVIAKAYAPFFTVIKYAGCAYLISLAVALWRQEPVAADCGVKAPAEKPFSAFLGSLFLTLGNPKVMIFFLSIMPLVIRPEDISPVVALELAITITIVISSILCAYMLLASRARSLFCAPRSLRIIQRVNAGVLAGAAVTIATR
jgi:threonine/homoserine/homoserine lactone efflux protein